MDLRGLANTLKIETRDYQLRIVQDTVDLFLGKYVNRAGQLESACNSIMINSPTGSGKTVIGLLVAKVLELETGCKVVWSAMRRNLLKQALDENANKGFDVNMHMNSMFDRKVPDHLRGENRTGKLLFVVDESHHDAADSMAALHEIYSPDMILGMSATPYRADNLRLCFQKVIRDAGIHELIELGYLSEYEHYTIPSYSPEEVAKVYLRDRERWGKTIVFFRVHEDCEEFRDRLAGAGVFCDLVTAKTNKEEQIEAFVSGDTQVLVNMMILTEGFDCPHLETVFCRPSGRGPTTQMCGRAFRKHPDVPVKRIVQCEETRHPFTKSARAREQFVWMNNEWRAILHSENMKLAGVRVLEILSETTTSLPEFISRKSRGPSLF